MRCDVTAYVKQSDNHRIAAQKITRRMNFFRENKRSGTSSHEFSINAMSWVHRARILYAQGLISNVSFYASRFEVRLRKGGFKDNIGPIFCLLSLMILASNERGFQFCWPSKSLALLWFSASSECFLNECPFIGLSLFSVGDWQILGYFACA